MHFDVIVIGAGAAGLMCAIEAGKRGRKVLVIDHANKPGKKILMSGGGRCNFTNLNISHERYLSGNPHFCKSALSRYTQWDFIALVEKYNISYHEKTLGQLFCDNKSKDILNMLLAECDAAGVQIKLSTAAKSIEQKSDRGFHIQTDQMKFSCESLVIATGGLSIPTLGASPFGYQVAKQFGIKVLPTQAGLVPLTFQGELKTQLSSLAGVSVLAKVSVSKQSFVENILFTHLGLSGPAILQISSYWSPGQAIIIDLLPHENLKQLFEVAKKEHPNQTVQTFLGYLLPKGLVKTFFSQYALQTLKSLPMVELEALHHQVHTWQIKPDNTEGYRTAEVTLGGVDCHEISSQTFEANQVKGLYFIGEVLDVTGWLGGYNFQWAWSSAWAAGCVV